MKAIMISIRPQHAENIMNLIKLLEIRKMFPSDYVGWVYIYVTNDRKDFLCEVDDYKELHKKGLAPFRYYLTPKRESKYHKCLNGKVVGRFWCDKVENTYNFYTEELCQLACISKEELCKYAGGWYKTGDLLAIRVTKVEPFDKPKEIKEFYGAFTHKRYERIFGNNVIELDKKYGGLRQPTRSGYEYTYPLTRAPQSWYYIEV